MIRCWKMVLVAPFFLSCAAGSVTRTWTGSCIAKGYAVGKGRLEVICTPKTEFSDGYNVKKPESLGPPVLTVDSRGNYHYFIPTEYCWELDNVSGKCVDSEIKGVVGATKIEISGGLPTSGFWGIVLEGLMFIAPFLIGI